MLKRFLRDGNRLAWVVTTAAILLLPLVTGPGFHLNVLNFIALYAMVAIGLSLLVGYCGQLSISHAAFFAVGAYASAIFSTRLGWPPLLAVVVAQAVAAPIAAGIGWLVLRLKGHFLAIATLAFSIIVEVALKEAAPLTGGLAGLSSIPPLALGGLALDTDVRFYYLAWPLAMLLLLFGLNLVDSRVGRAFRAIREGEEVARMFGAAVRAYKVKVFVLSSVFASLAGSLYAHFVTFVSPATASLLFAIEIILVLAFGGFTLLWGAMLGVASLTVLNELLARFGDWKRPAYGLALIVIMLFFPQGLLPGLKRSVAALARGLR